MEKDISQVTEEMILAGEEIASDLIDASIHQSMSGITGVTYEDSPNEDLISAYLSGKICSVTAIYIAMQRKATK